MKGKQREYWRKGNRGIENTGKKGKQSSRDYWRKKGKQREYWRMKGKQREYWRKGNRGIEILEKERETEQ